MKLLAFLFTIFLTSAAAAQYWRALPLENARTAPYAFSHDDKRVISFGSDGRITSFDLKTNTVAEIAPAGERTLPMQLVARPYLLYSKHVDTDHHIFRLKNDGSVPEEDLTPITGMLNSILGQSYSGRYIYYASLQKSRDKTDFYRYDAQQNISELVLANDKNYKVHAWSRDQKRLLVENPATHELVIVDITTTDRFPIYTPLAGRHIVQAGWTADNKNILALERSGVGMELRSIPMTTTTSISEDIKIIKEGNFTSFDLSPNGKYLMLLAPSGTELQEEIYDLATMKPLALPPGAKDFVFNAKETLALYHTEGDNKLYLYDIAKQSPRELVAK